MSVKRVYVEKKEGFNIEANKLLHEIESNLSIKGIEKLRVINRYDVQGLSDEDYQKAKFIIFSEPPVDYVYDEEFPIEEKEFIIATELLPGQYDQRADSAQQCIQIITKDEKPIVRFARLIAIKGELSENDVNSIKKFIINPVESHEAKLLKPTNLENYYRTPDDVKIIDGFIEKSEKELLVMMSTFGFAMSIEDLIFCQKYFRDTEKRDPSETELKVIDTYWSDHCRHTTFLTNIENVEFEEGRISHRIKEVYDDYLSTREELYKGKDKDICLMDIATIAMKKLKSQGLLNDLDESDEINACSIVVEPEINGVKQKWLVMFKNETHNHPTEIEPFGGAATCLGGAIRDPLSGRSYVYQAMRVTGSGDPRTKIEDTLPGKLPQRVITKGAAHGYSSYGNQIGLATGIVNEIYDGGYVAKRMEIGAVIAAEPKDNVRRSKPEPSDLIILLGGRTGRDGCGGATGSSKEHTEESLANCGAEVQKGNPPTERKIQRLFRDKEVSRLIKKCNDFGAGGVCVAIGELADGLAIDLDKVPKKYEGLDGTELAISESQERMAVVVEKKDADAFIMKARNENLEANVVAEVKDEKRLVMTWRSKKIVDISRAFLDTNGVKQKTNVKVTEPNEESYFGKAYIKSDIKIKEEWLKNLKQLNVCSQKGLVEMFDSTIGAATVLMPFGGKTQLTPAEGMAAKLPVEDGDTDMGTLMTFGYNPNISKWSPFHGAVYAVLESVAKIVAMGGNHKKVRLTLQEYFEKLYKDPVKWGKPLSALLGAYYAQSNLGIPAIGGKDSMSGSFKDMDVPPTLVSFAVDTVDVNRVISPEFKANGNNVVVISVKKDEDYLPDFKHVIYTYDRLRELIHSGEVISACTLKFGGIAEAVSKMSFGNSIGLKFTNEIKNEELFTPSYGDIVVEINGESNFKELLKDLNYKYIGKTQEAEYIEVNGEKISIKDMKSAWEGVLEDVFPTQTESLKATAKCYSYNNGSIIKCSHKYAKPRVFIPVFPGTNCEYDTKRAFDKAGGSAHTYVINNLSAREIEESVNNIVKQIDNSQIIVFPGGFSAGDEPEGSGKFIAAVFKNPYISEAVMRLIKQRDGLILGICNGFQALIKLGLLPYGEIRDLEPDSPTLTFNEIGRHVSCLARTRVASNLSPWLSQVNVDDVNLVALSHGEGRFVANSEVIQKLAQNGQIATQYVDYQGKPSNDICFNANGSIDAIEGITSPDGRIFGKMGHNERYSGNNTLKNIVGNKEQKIVEAGVKYYL